MNVYKNNCISHDHDEGNGRNYPSDLLLITTMVVTSNLAFGVPGEANGAGAEDMRLRVARWHVGVGRPLRRHVFIIEL